jgi:Asp-tRNA(Asn)/Glu-tRNA(Gln) amidotransferase A subunit family amidase
VNDVRRFVTAVTTAGLAVTMETLLAAQGPASFRMNEVSVDDLQAALRSTRVTCREVVDYYRRRIAAYDKQGPALNAVQTVNPRALAEADRLDAAMRTTGPAGPLHCVPILVKDQFDTADMPTTFGSAAFKDFVPARDASVVTKLRNAGAVLIGKATMGEFASGYAGSASGPVRNAYDVRRHPSGSSSGTGAGMAADFATVGLAEDTGGSVRGPAAAGSLVGHRPTLALVSRHGMLPARPSYDTVGPIARSVKDAAILLDVIAGFDPDDPVTAYVVGQIPTSFTTALTREALKGARLGVIRHPMHQATDPTAPDYGAIRSVFDRALGEVKGLGADPEKRTMSPPGEVAT